MTKKYLEVKFKSNIKISKKFKANTKKHFNQVRNIVCKDHDEWQGEPSMLEFLQWLKAWQPMDYDTIMFVEFHKRPYELCDKYGLIQKFINGDIEVSPIGEWILEKGCDS